MLKLFFFFFPLFPPMNEANHDYFLYMGTKSEKLMKGEKEKMKRIPYHLAVVICN